VRVFNAHIVEWGVLLARDMRTLLLLAFCGGTLLAATGTGMVRSVEFQKFQGVSAKEIAQRLNDRDIQLVERPYDAQCVATAQQIVEELLAEKGRKGTQVKATITELRGGAVKVTFAPAK
jgi:outer membrane protein assembly factor BamA